VTERSSWSSCLVRFFFSGFFCFRGFSFFVAFLIFFLGASAGLENQLVSFFLSASNMVIEGGKDL